MTIATQKTVTTFSINKENWEVKKAKLKEKFPHLTEPDLEFEEGKVEELLGKIHAKIGNTIGKTKDGLHKFIESL